MKLATVREFRDQATRLLRSEEPVMITRRGKIAGFYLPVEGDELPLELKSEIFRLLTQAIRRGLQDEGLTEDDILADFEATREARR